MENLGVNYIIYAVIAILIVLIIVSIVKKAIKLVIFLIILVLGFSAYNIFVKGVSPMEEASGYTTNIEYGKSIADYTVKIKTSVDNTKKAVDAKPVDLETIKTENSNLHKYQAEVQSLRHTEKLNSFHNSYCGYLDTVTSSSDGITKAITAGEKGMVTVDGIVEKLNSSLNALGNLKLK